MGDKNKGLDKHGKCDSHIAAVKAWENYQSNPVSIDERLTPGRPAVVDQNRDYFTKIIKYIRWFCLQEVAFRGVEEHDDESDKRGNFRELMELEFELHSEFDAQRQAIKSQYSIHTDYLSKTIYNEFITIMSSQVKEAIFQEVASTKFFSVIVDECKDVCNFEQLSLCLRYSIGSRPIERFVRIAHLSEGSYTAQDIVKEVEKLVTELVGFGCMLTGLGADGASVMSGEWAGVQALLKQNYPWLIYIHCVAHRLNLVVVKSLKGTCKNILTLVDKLHSLFSSAKTNDIFVQIQQQSKVKVMAMPERSETRWSSMFYVLDVLCTRYKEILMTLVKRAADTDDPAIIAGGLYHKLASGEMILTCVVMKKALAITTNLSDLLQSSQLEWTNAAEEIEMCKRLITSLKEDKSISSIVDEATTVSRKCAIPLNITSHVYNIRSHFSNTEVDVCKFTKDFVVKVCDKIAAEMLLRFPPESMVILKGMDALNATSSRFLDEQLLLQLVDHYGADALDLNKTLLQVEVQKYKLQCDPSIQMCTDATKIDPKFYPNLMKLFHLKRSLPVSSAEAERSFSTMKRVKKPLRNRLTDAKMSDLCLLSSERDITKKLDINNVINIFNETPRRIPLLQGTKR